MFMSCFVMTVLIASADTVDGSLPQPYSTYVTETGGTSALAICSLPDDAIGWNLRYRSVAAEGEQEMRWVIQNNLTTRSYTIEDLTPATNYEIQFQAVFGEEEMSDWTPALTFTTADENAGERENKQETAFNEYKIVKKAECDAMATADDDDWCTLLIAKAKYDIDALAFDENKSLDENLEVLESITRMLAIDLSLYRGIYTGVEVVSKSAIGNSDLWYDLSGRRLPAKPIGKGVFIHNGKTIILK